MKLFKITLILLTAVYSVVSVSASTPSGPYLRTQGSATQLMVDGKPFLIRGGELGNSMASNLEHLAPHWQKFQKLNINTILAPVYWDLIEPKEGEFDFTLVKGLIKEARAHDMKLVLLWFGSWKNSMSSYVPEWVKVDYERFPRARDRNGQAYEILSPLFSENFQADAKAFHALMRFIKKNDKDQTVIMVQPENEIGMVNYAREYSDRANHMYASEVPVVLMEYLQKHKAELTPELIQAWSKSNYKTQGSWATVFGDSPQTEELFMAWHFASYTEMVARAGKEAYDIPMFVNAALIRPGYQPGQYVSAGPLPHLIDIWRAAAPSIDFITPDIYFPNFTYWTEKYTRKGNPLFIPEALRNEKASVNAMYAFGEHDAIGFCPFGIESINGLAFETLRASYDLLKQLTPLIVEHQGKGTMRGFLQISDQQKAPQQVRFGPYEMNVKFEYAPPPALADGVINEADDVSRGPLFPAGGLVIQLSDNEFIFAGAGLTITFDSLTADEQAGIVSAETGEFIKGKWTNRWWNNGDQTHQGRHVRLEPGYFSMQKVKLYRYR